MEFRRCWMISFSLVLSCLSLLIKGEITSEHYSRKCGPNKKLSRTAAETLEVATNLACGARCSEDATCIGFNYNKATMSCDLFLTGFLPQDCTDSEIVEATGVTFFAVHQLCENEGVWTGDKCECISSWAGARCERLAVDCSEIYHYCPSCHADFAVHVIQPPGGEPFLVKCYLQWGGYTYIMERYDSNCKKVSFTQTWADYKVGFGDLANFECDFWLGLEKVRRLTSTPGRVYMLDTTVAFQDPSLADYYQTYLDGFYIEDEANGYRLHSAGWHDGQSAQAGDAYFLTPGDANSMIGQMFSTVDRDQDSSTGHCADTFQSGWWFSDCGKVNPTGEWKLTADNSRDTSIQSMWWGVNGFGDRAIRRLDIKIFGENA